MIQTLSYDEQSRLLRAILDERRSTTGPHGLKVRRDLVLILLGLRCGFRVGECQKLRVSDVWENDRPVDRIHVPANFNKNNVEGWVIIPDDLKEALKDFVPLRLAVNNPPVEDPILLPSRPSLKAISDRLSRPAVVDILEYWRLRGGLPHIKFHTLRHTFATNLLKSGRGDLKIVQMMLRHRSLSSSSCYLHPSQDDCDIAVRAACNPAPQAQA